MPDNVVYSNSVLLSILKTLHVFQFFRDYDSA